MIGNKFGGYSLNKSIIKQLCRGSNHEIIYILIQQKGKIQIKNKGICCFVVLRVMALAMTY